MIEVLIEKFITSQLLSFFRSDDEGPFFQKAVGILMVLFKPTQRQTRVGFSHRFIHFQGCFHVIRHRKRDSLDFLSLLMPLMRLAFMTDEATGNACKKAVLTGVIPRIQIGTKKLSRPFVVVSFDISRVQADEPILSWFVAVGGGGGLLGVVVRVPSPVTIFVGIEVAIEACIIRFD